MLGKKVPVAAISLMVSGAYCLVFQVLIKPFSWSEVGIGFSVGAYFAALLLAAAVYDDGN
jgi:hypothetical protein